MKVLMMVLMVGLMGCSSNGIKTPVFKTNGSYPVGTAELVKKGYNGNGATLCFYAVELQGFSIASAHLDRMRHGRCPLFVEIIGV